MTRVRGYAIIDDSERQKERKRSTWNIRKEEMKMYAIKLTNMFQNAYGNQHQDGLLSEDDCYGDSDRDCDRHNIQTFETKGVAEEFAETLYFHDAPELIVVEIPSK